MFKSFLPGLALLAGCALLNVAQAATPANGSLTDTVPADHKLTYKTVTFTVSNPTPIPMVDSGPECTGSTQPCDRYVLTTKFPAGYAAAHPSAAIKVSAGWTDAGSGNSDYDLDIYKGDVPTVDGSKTADYGSSSAANPEVGTIFPIVDGTMAYTIFVVPYTSTGESVNVIIEFSAGAAAAPGGSTGGGTTTPVVFGIASASSPGTPRYQVMVPPKGTSAEAGSGEFNIGFNPKTKRIMTMNTGPIWRITPAEVVNANNPEACDATWEDKSSTITDTGLDPILWTDQKSGRTFASNSTAGANGLYAYTDNDGDLWTPLGASPPAGADHQTIGTGPYPASLSALGVAAVNQGEYVVYCTQDLVGANCQRSDDFGSSFGPAIPATGPGASNSQGCGGLHGHVHVSKDGTAFLPDNSCSTNADGELQGGAFTLDAGTTPWTEFVVNKTAADSDGPAFKAVSQTNGADPSVGLDDANTIYYCYINNEANGTEGHAHVAVGKRSGSTIKWLRDTDVGKAVGMVNGAHTEAVAGSTGRAACGFMATDKPGNYQALDFAGNWYIYIATTFDEGKTWSTVNATPNDPVQHASGIWQQGGGETQRNLLDFNEVTTDDRGRVLYGYSDGCVTVGCIGGSAANDFVAHMRVARQWGGKSLFASYDAMTDTDTPVAPKASCLAGTRIPASSTLTWKVPDSGGNEIQKYEIYRSNVKDQLGTKIGETADAKPLYVDTTAGTEPTWYYTVKAVNTLSTIGKASNQITLPIGTAPVVESLCVLPGLTVLTDAAGDNTGGVAAQDVQSLRVGQSYRTDGKYLVTFTLKVASLSTVPPNTQWPISFDGPDGKQYGARMRTGTTGAPVFEYFLARTSGTNDRRDGVAPNSTADTKVADSSSTYTAAGIITIVVPAADLGFSKPGDKVSNFLTRIVADGVAVSVFPDSMPDNLARSGSVTLPGNAFCRPNNAPVVNLFSATPTMGVTPLTVSFTGAASDPDTDNPADTIATWHIDFGDGTSVDTTTAPSGLTHTYTNASSTANATYNAKLTVTDSRGLDSATGRGQVITVQPKAGSTPIPVTPPTIGNGSGTATSVTGTSSRDSGRFGGGALGWLTLLPLLAAARRRRRH